MAAAGKLDATTLVLGTGSASAVEDAKLPTLWCSCSSTLRKIQEGEHGSVEDATAAMET